MQLFPSSQAILSIEKQPGKNKLETPDSRRSYRICQSREQRAARLWQGLLNPLLLSCLFLNLLPIAPSSIVICNSTLACFSLQHLTLLSFPEGLIPADTTLPNQQTQQKSFNQYRIFYQILLTLSITSSFPAALCK